MAAPASASASAIEPGHKVGAYTLTREIGKGSFAVVFQGKVRPAPLARMNDDGEFCGDEDKAAHAAITAPSPVTITRVAIKIVTRNKLTAKLLENLEGEISILRTVRHANIVELIDCLKTSSHIYLIMQYCRMGDLSNFIRSRRQTESFGQQKQSQIGDRRQDPFEREVDRQYPSPHDGGLHGEVTRSFLAQLASALHFMRGKNIVHRDIKPQNLLLQEPEIETIAAGHPAFIPQLKVADFGFARHLEAASLAETLCGSPLYMAPEILRYEKYDAKADLWSVGAVLFEMCVGKPPFRASNHVELLRRIERGEDKIKFPDERSDESLQREQARKADDGKGSTGGGELVRPHPVEEDVKQLIRNLLRRRPIERMSFEDFFACDVLVDYKIKTTKATGRLSGITSSASLENHGVSRVSSPSSSIMPVAHRLAPAVPSSAPSPKPAETAVGIVDENDGNQAGAPVPDATEGAIPLASPAPSGALRRYFAPKYVVGGRKPLAGPRVEVPNSDSGTPTLPKVTPTNVSVPSRVLASSPATRLAHADLNEGEASSLEDNVLETPGSSVSHLPTTTAAKGARPTSAGTKGHNKASSQDDDRGDVMVEKRNVDVNALADEMSNLGKPARLAGWSPLNAVRRPSQLGRLASLGATSPLSVLSGSPSQAVAHFVPSSPQQQRTGLSRASPEATSPLSYQQQPAAGINMVRVSPSAGCSSPVQQRYGSTPPNAPFALPLGARKPSISRRASNHSDGTRLAHMSPRPSLSPLVPSSAPTVTHLTGGVPTATSSSALTRAISMASIRLFGVPTSLSMRGAGVRRSLRMGLGTGTFLSSSPGGQTYDGASSAGLTNSDVAEHNLLSVLHEYSQKSFVLSEFADARLSNYFADGPYQIDHVEQHRSSGGSQPSQQQRTNTASGHAARLEPDGHSPIASDSEVAASEAYVLYVRSLGFLQRALDIAREYLEARSVSGSVSRYAAPLQLPISQDVTDAVQWLRAKFSDGVERASFARGKSSEDMPESAQYIDKMIFEQALEIARGAAVDELESSRAASSANDPSSSASTWNSDRCLLAYETACTMLQGLLDPGEASKDLSASAVGTIETFVRSITKRMASIQRKYDGTTSVLAV